MDVVSVRIIKPAKKSSDKPVKIISNELKKINSPIAARMPKVDSISRRVQRNRRKSSPQIANPSTRGEIILLNELRMTSNNEEFLLYDSSGCDSRFLMFGTSKNF